MPHDLYTILTSFQKKIPFTGDTQPLEQCGYKQKLQHYSIILIAIVISKCYRPDIFVQILLTKKIWVIIES